MSTRLVHMRTVAAWFAFASLAIACADFGPFRAADDQRGDPDGGTSDGSATGGIDAGPDGGGSASPQPLATTTARPTGLAVSGGHVYWGELDPTAVARVATTGGSVMRLAVSAPPLQLAASDGRLFWTTTTQVVGTNSAFTAVAPLVTSSQQLHGSLALSAEHIYFATSSGPTTDRIQRVARTGGTAELLYDSLTSRPRLATTATSLYWTAYASGSEIRRSSLATLTSYTVATSASVLELFAGGNTVCWTTQPDVNAYRYDIWCLRQGQLTRISTANYEIYGMVVTDTDVTFAARDYPSTGHILRYTFASQSTAVVEVSPAGSYPTALARDGNDLYWVDSHTTPEGAATVWRVALPATSGA